MAIGVKRSSGGHGGGGGEGDNVFWTTMSDLMLGLAIIFMTLFTLAMTGFSQNSVQQKQVRVFRSRQV